MKRGLSHPIGVGPMKKTRKTTIKRYLVLMSTGGRDWKLWELVTLILSVVVVVAVLMWSLLWGVGL